MSTNISFTTTAAESDLIDEILDRARKLGLYGDRKRFELEMDIKAAHANGTPLDFARLLDFPDFDFVHDVGGIIRHLDRTTGQLEDCFLPRCAKPSPHPVEWLDRVAKAAP